jgi:hypothetical protein
MGWSSWYGFTQNINESMLREMADGMVSSGLHAAGYEHLWIDDGWCAERACFRACGAAILRDRSGTTATCDCCCCCCCCARVYVRAVGRENSTGGCGELGPTKGTSDSCRVIVEKSLFPSGMANLSAEIHAKGLKFGICEFKLPLWRIKYHPTWTVLHRQRMEYSFRFGRRHIQGSADVSRLPTDATQAPR